jgi:hypothetical protein
MIRFMDFQTIFRELGALMTYREVAAKVGLCSASQAHKIAFGKQKTVTYDVGKAAILLWRTQKGKITKQANKAARAATAEEAKTLPVEIAS